MGLACEGGEMETHTVNGICFEDDICIREILWHGDLIAKTTAVARASKDPINRHGDES